MKTDICKKLGIEYPIFAFTHCRDVVVAVSKAGGIGVLGAVGYSPEQLKEELDWIDENIGDYPYGVDTVIPQKYEGMDEKDPENLLINCYRKMAFLKLQKQMAQKEDCLVGQKQQLNLKLKKL
jgi:NAD(P)H-dependent flavin oxidoreductase YrpB (nitropropane dioxygenase family)